jgi:hypothetical protein
MINLVNKSRKQSSHTSKSPPKNAFATDGSGPGALSALSDLNFLKLFDPNSPWVVSILIMFLKSCHGAILITSDACCNIT